MIAVITSLAVLFEYINFEYYILINARGQILIS